MRMLACSPSTSDLSTTFSCFDGGYFQWCKTTVTDDRCKRHRIHFRNFFQVYVCQDSNQWSKNCPMFQTTNWGFTELYLNVAFQSGLLYFIRIGQCFSNFLLLWPWQLLVKLRGPLLWQHRLCFYCINKHISLIGVNPLVWF